MAEIGQVGGPASVGKISQIGTENDRILPGVVSMFKKKGTNWQEFEDVSVQKM
jgi:hypothetical protein